MGEGEEGGRDLSRLAFLSFRHKILQLAKVKKKGSDTL